MSGIQYPVDIKDIGKFEHQNNISVNIYRRKDKKIFPLSITTVAHKVLVKKFSSLVLRQYNNDSKKKYFCQYRLYGFTSEEVLKNHMERWKLHGAQRIKLLEAGDKKGSDKVKFTKTEYQLRLPFVIYVDLKSVLRKQNSCEPSPSKFFTTQYQYHVAYGSCI